MALSNELLLWLDIETTGLNVENCYILELACILTSFDGKTQFFKEEYVLKSHVSVAQMDPWCQEQHEKSGLLDKVKYSNLTEKEVERDILTLLQSYSCLENFKLYIAGNSVHFDKAFIKKYMPTLHEKLDHRILDVSSLAIIYKNLHPNIYKNRPPKKYNHTALYDILESIEEYRYYLKTFDSSCVPFAFH